jgi:hypothetical protein
LIAKCNFCLLGGAGSQPHLLLRKHLWILGLIILYTWELISLKGVRGMILGKTSVSH